MRALTEALVGDVARPQRTRGTLSWLRCEHQDVPWLRAWSRSARRGGALGLTRGLEIGCVLGLAGLFGLLGFGACGLSDAEVTTYRTEAAIIAGVREKRLDSVVQIESRYERGSVGKTELCSGMWIADNKILTAAHCVQERDAKGEMPLVRVSVDILRFDEDGNKRLLRASTDTPAPHVHPDYNGFLRAGSDIAMVEVPGLNLDGTPLQASQKPAFLLPIWTPSDVDDWHGFPIAMAGYGATSLEVVESGPPLVKGQGERRVGFSTIGTVDDLARNIGNLEEPVSAFQAASLVSVPSESGQTTCAGDSGGPVLMHAGGRYALVGVTSFGDSDCARVSVASRIDAAFMRSVFPEQTLLRRDVSLEDELSRAGENAEEQAAGDGQGHAGGAEEDAPGGQQAEGPDVLVWRVRLTHEASGDPGTPDSGTLEPGTGDLETPPVLEGQRVVLDAVDAAPFARGSYVATEVTEDGGQVVPNLAADDAGGRLFWRARDLAEGESTVLTLRFVAQAVEGVHVRATVEPTGRYLDLRGENNAFQRTLRWSDAGPEVPEGGGCNAGASASNAGAAPWLWLLLGVMAAWRRVAVRPRSTAKNH